MPAIDVIKERRGFATEWATANPVLADGEVGYEKDSRLTKHGDGVTAWNDLEYDNTYLGEVTSIDGGDATSDFSVSFDGGGA